MTCSKSLIDLFGDFFGNTNLYITNMGYEGFSGTLSFTMYAVLCMVLSLLLAVIAFFLILILAKHSKTKAITVFECLSVASAVASAVCFTLGVKGAPAELGINFGSFPVYNATGGVAWGFYVALALLLVAVGINAAVAKAPAKSDDVLEAERLERKAIKEKKEQEEALRKEIEREEAEKREKEEQARIVEEAKAKLAEREAKKKK